MVRKSRIDKGGLYYRVYNKACWDKTLFENEDDFRIVKEKFSEAKSATKMRILAYCFMPDHFYLILYPVNDGDMRKFMQLAIGAHTHWWHRMHKTSGSGPIYKGRYKSEIIPEDQLSQQIEEVESCPVRDKCAETPVEYKHSSASARVEKDFMLLTK
ncbi:MAG: transposase [Patescibacteria group bacterium]